MRRRGEERRGARRFEEEGGGARRSEEERRGVRRSEEERGGRDPCQGVPPGSHVTTGLSRYHRVLSLPPGSLVTTGLSRYRRTSHGVTRAVLRTSPPSNPLAVEDGEKK